MTVDWLGLILWVGGFGTLIVVAVTLVRRSERRLGTGPGDEYASIVPRVGSDGIVSSVGTGHDADGLISAYLAGVARELALPAADVAEVKVELIDHLTDSIASLEVEGMDHETAVREALGRLGPAAELGRQLGAAHQSTRRLLAGAGGGVIAAGGGFVLGYLGGFAVGFVIFIGLALLGTLLDKLGVPLPDLTAIGGYNIGNDLFLCFILAVGAAVAMRYAVRTSAGLSRRAPRTIAVFWAVAGTLVFGWWALFGSVGQQGWLQVAGEVLIPVAAIAGASYRIERPMPHVGRWALVVSVSTIAVLGLSVLLLTAATTVRPHRPPGLRQPTSATTRTTRAALSGSSCRSLTLHNRSGHPQHFRSTRSWRTGATSSSRPGIPTRTTFRQTQWGSTPTTRTHSWWSRLPSRGTRCRPRSTSNAFATPESGGSCSPASAPMDIDIGWPTAGATPLRSAGRPGTGSRRRNDVGPAPARPGRDRRSRPSPIA